MPSWIGNTDHFLVNSDHQLQLKASSSGNSILCTALIIPDSIRWDMYINLQFDPSSSNKLRIYILLDTIDLTLANGYYFEIGQNGSADPMHFFSLEKGESYLLGSSTHIFQDKISTHISIIRDVLGNWTFYTDHGDDNIIEILRLTDKTFRPDFNRLFCIECYYSTTRRDKFFFDDIMVRQLETDTIPPVLIEINALDSNHLKLTFNEKIASDNMIENINIEPGIGYPSEVHVIGHTLQIELKNEFVIGKTYMCTANDIPDTAQNLSGPMQMQFEYIKKSLPQPGDIVINEVLFDPTSGDSPFIELYNTSAKFIYSNDIVLSIENDNVISEIPDLKDHLIHPDAFIVFTTDRFSTIFSYPSSNSSSIFEIDLPSISRDFGSMILQTRSGSVIDSVFYHKNFHHALLDDPRGVSLERINPESQARSAFEWNSASQQSGWATPGLPNSQYIQFDSISTSFQIENQVFSPNGDGHEDFLLIRFADAAAGQLATAKIYDEFGREAAVLLRNELVGHGSTGKWDGTINAQDLATTGIYILLIEMMEETGIVTTYKEAIVLAAGF